MIAFGLSRLRMPALVAILTLVSLLAPPGSAGVTLARSPEGPTPAGNPPAATAGGPSPVQTEANGVLLDLTMHSRLLDMDLPCRVYLPPGYFSTSERYPVLYLLHGGGSDYTEWTSKNHVQDFADRLIASRRIQPMLIAMPEGKHSYFMNHANDGQRWGDYLAEEVVSFIDRSFRTIPDRAHRAVGGLSMGGEGALQLAFNYPAVFSIVGAHSPALYTPEDELPAFFGDLRYFSHYDPLTLAATRRAASSLQIWIDVGDGDPYLRATTSLHSILLARGIPHQWNVYPGPHDNSYWSEHTSDYLVFYSSAFVLGERHATASHAGP